MLRCADARARRQGLGAGRGLGYDRRQHLVTRSHTAVHQCVYSVVSTRRRRRPNVADSEAARPVCTALGMGRLRTGQQPEAGLLLHKRAPTRRQCVDGLIPRSVRTIHCDIYKMPDILIARGPAGARRGLAGAAPASPPLRPAPRARSCNFIFVAGAAVPHLCRAENEVSP